ncbi:hypothetical protein G6F61_014788 [Rhizopus arrhizus]|nr:hypothetical protein G6F61_014788 [Rhizopus arrhizus]
MQAAQVLEAGQQLQAGHGDQRQAWRGAQALGGGTAVGADQAAGTELDAAEPARHHHHHPVETLAIDGGQDRPPGGACGLAIVAGAVVLPMARLCLTSSV